MAAFFLLLSLLFVAASGESPIVNDDDCVEPTPPCPKNEERRCRQPCPPETCITLYAAFDCIANQTCIEGCYCKKGFLRSSVNGTCVLPDQCLPLECVNDPNAIKGCGNRCGKTCADYNDKCKICAKGPCKKNGCDCKDGYIYDDNVGKCVRPKECTKQCTKPNERYSNCVLGECVPKKCEDLGKPLPCPGIVGPCADGCICKEGYVRNSNGDCIETIKCPSCGGDPNAVSGCGNPCGKTCDSYNKTNLGCAQYCEVNGCDCKNGFVLNQVTKKCVLIKDCPKPQQCTKPHERYSKCPLGECEAKTCDDLGKPIACPAIAEPCPGGCVCEKGYVRNKQGECIEKKNCPSCGGDPNAVSGCGNPCGKTCDSYNKTDIVCLQYCEVNGCDCRDGFVLDEDLKKCVLKKDCPKTKQCTKPHEKYSNCPLGECVAKTCDELGKPIACPSIADPCPGGCICEEGYVRNKLGVCIEKKNCPSCGGDPNAVSGCGNPCGKTCDTYNKTLPCPLYCKENGCDCKNGYVLNQDTQKCVLIKNCPKTNCGGDPNAVSGCGNPCGKTCDDYNKTDLICPQYCKVGGCDCKDGYVLNQDTQKCVLKKDCPKPITCTKPHERYIDCLSGQCLPKTCEDLGKSLPCPFIRGPCPGGCICEGGYLRDANGTCIKLEQCPPKPCGTNQTWVSPCNFPCPDKICPRDDKPTPKCEVLQPCYPGCQCKLNYRLNATRHCILAPDCPAVKCTRQNEVYDSCPSACLRENCEDINNQPKTCNTLIWLCSPRCVCAKGYFRNKDGLCIPANQCPVQCTKPNEKYIDCLPGQCNPKTCDELENPAPCPRIKPPCPGGCICVEGYVRNANGTCIKKENCPKTCKGPNERYTDCVSGQCKPTTCKEVVQMPSCPVVKPGSCRGGCVCTRGYVRSDNGTCVAIKDCPEAGTCQSKNETWVQCAANCGPAYCPKDDQPQLNCFLPAGSCSPGCHCKPNYRINNKNNQCILASECPPVTCTRPNEEYNSCPPNRITSCDQLGTTPPPNDGPRTCQPGCICKKGFYKNSSNICVPECECPSTDS